MSDELRAILLGELERHRPQGRPTVADLMGKRRRARRRRAVVGAVVVMLWAGSALGIPEFGRSERPSRLATVTAAANAAQAIVGLRTDPDGLGLLASYGGGACDGPTSLAVSESSERVDVELDRGAAPQLASGTACLAIGLSKTVAASLTSPLGKRVVVNAGSYLTVFDGRRLLGPIGSATAGMVVTEDSGSSDRTATPQSGGATWTRVFAARRGPDNNRCATGPSPYRITQGPAQPPEALSDDFVDRGSPGIGSTRGRLYQGTYFDGTPLGWVLQWTAAGGNVSLDVSPSCKGDSIPTEDEVLAFARSLRAAV